MLPNLEGIINQVHIPFSHRNDELRWIHSHAGSLSLKDAYQFKITPINNLDWARLIWNTYIPPPKSLFVWKLILSKVPTDDILTNRGIFLFPSKCVICGIHEEITDHLF